MNVLVALQVVLVDHVVIVKVQSLVLAVIVLDCAGLVFGCVIVIVGARVSIVKVFTDKVLLVFPASSFTVMVQSLYVPSAKVAKVTVLFPVIALISIKGLQLQP